MTQSMTAFARVQDQDGPAVISWEIRSVNHRYLDVSFRLPETVRYLEVNLRNLLSGKINRGKLECQLKISDSSNDNQPIQINVGLVKALLNAGEQLTAHQQLLNDLTVSHVLSWPGVFQFGQPDLDCLSRQIEQSFQTALKQLQAARKMEGDKLQHLIIKRLDLLTAELQQAREQVSMNAGQMKEKLLGRLQQLQLDVNEARIEQEIAMLLTRLDVSEELDRLQAHIDEVRRTMNSEEASGRRLDFLMQELNREANTLSSKSDSAALTQCAVQMKVLIEQMREQIQNIE